MPAERLISFFLSAGAGGGRDWRALPLALVDPSPRPSSARPPALHVGGGATVLTEAAGRVERVDGKVEAAAVLEDQQVPGGEAAAGDEAAPPPPRQVQVAPVLAVSVEFHVPWPSRGVAQRGGGAARRPEARRELGRQALIECN